MKAQRKAAFSLVELVIVVTIIGTITAIAIPRVSRASRSSTSSALQDTLANVRKAIDMYYAEHNRYPGYNPADKTADHDRFIPQLTQFTDDKGNTQASYGFPFIYGPYLRRAFPKNPMNGLDSVHVKAAPGAADPADGSVGWIAVLSHGYFGVSASDADIDDVSDGDVGVKTIIKGGVRQN